MSRKHQLSNRIMFMLFISFLILLLITMQILFTNSKESVHKTFGNNAVYTAKTIANFINQEKLQSVKDNLAEDDTYWELREYLNEIREHNGVLYAYTITLDESGQPIFLVDGMPIDNNEDVGIVGTRSTVPQENIEEATEKGSSYSGIEETSFGSYITGIIPLKNSAGEIYAYLGVDIDSTHANSIAQQVAKEVLPKIIGMFLIFLVLAIGFIYIYVKRTLKPMTTLVTSVQALAQGDIQTALKEIDNINLKSKNEITLFTTQYKDALNQMANSFKEIHQKTLEWKDSLKGILVAAENVEESKEQIARSVNRIAAGSNQQQTNNTEIVTAISDMTIGIQQLADTSTEIVDASYEMKQLVEQSVENANDVMRQIDSMQTSVQLTSKHVQEMSERSVAMTNMISAITSIADQTNLLALNAAIEAARAGDAGKGFAVVAGEVRKLAEMSANSANEINEQLTAFIEMTEKALAEMNRSTTDVHESSDAVRSIGQQLHQIEESVAVVNDKIVTTSAVIEEMSAGSEEILASTEDMNELVKRNAYEANGVVKETELQIEVAKALNDSVHNLERVSNMIIEEIDKFKI